MLKGFIVIKDIAMLEDIESRLREFQKKLKKEKPLTEKEDRLLKLYLFADAGPGRTARDDDHRLQIIEQWLKEAPLHAKSLKRQEEKEEKK